MTQFQLEHFLPYQLNVLADHISKSFAARYQAAYGISVAEWRVVAHLSRGAPVSVREITAQVRLDKSRVSRAAARLETLGYIRKRPNPADRRLVALELTPAGRAMMEDLAPLAAQFEAELLAQLGAGAPGFRAGVAALLDIDET